MADPGAKRAVTVADVAREARVSKATAARVLGNYGSVGDELRDRILKAAALLDYRPNDLARTMATGRSATVGVVVGDIENPFFGLVVRGINDRAKELGFGMLLANSGEDVAEERTAVRMLLGKRVDGLVLAPTARGESDHLRDALSRGVPLVLVDRTVTGLEVDCVVADNAAAARRATRLLLDAGHRRISYITATEASDPHLRDLSQIVLTTVLDRIEGFLAVARGAGIARPERWVRLGASSADRARAILGELLSAPERPTAVIASDSMIALSVFRAARLAGLRIPDDLSLVTFDDAEWMSALTPTVTVLAQPAYDLGAVAMAILAEGIGGRAGVRRSVLPTTLVERESVAPPRSPAE